nr:PREDICTED: TPA-induced transmembrane protein [Latimeria chalumnae]|eukprot:XP_006009359.1 PREDICTED: TPA-induced transmembrane protein [Latimeria chalumnae]
MAIISGFVIFVLVIVISLVLYSVVYEDEDEFVDPSIKSSGISLYYIGTLKITNQHLLPEVLQTESEDSRNLSKQLSNLLTHVYISSPALSRYFISASVLAFSNSSVTACYQLQFSSPISDLDIQRYTLSQEMLINVLQQHIYDLEDTGQKSLEVDPLSLTLKESRNFSVQCDIPKAV